MFSATNEYLRTDEQTDVLTSLQEVDHQMDRILAGSISSWKWAVIAISNCLNGALVCNLSGSMNIGGLRKIDAVKCIKYRGRTEGKLFLASFKELMSRATGSEKRLEHAGPNVQLSGSEEKSFESLLTLRNDFMHFQPMGWSIEVAFMKEILLDVLSLIERIVGDGWSLRHLEFSEAPDPLAVSASIRSKLKLV